MSRRVVVIGSANVDLVWHGPRLPGPGETVTDGEFVQVLGGKGANQAAAAAALGAEVQFVGCVGDDEHGRLVRADLATRGVDCSGLAAAPHVPTGVALITVDARGENSVAVAPGANRALGVGAVETIRSGDIVLCSLEIPVETVVAAVAAANARGALPIVNPAPPRAAPAGALLTPNEHECAHFGGVDRLLESAPAVVVTRGAAGAVLHRPGVGSFEQAGFAVDVVDTTGAGDALNGALAWALSEGIEIEDALRLACAAGALATRAVGARASLPTAAEVYALANL